MAPRTQWSVDCGRPEKGCGDCPSRSPGTGAENLTARCHNRACLADLADTGNTKSQGREKGSRSGVLVGRKNQRTPCVRQNLPQSVRPFPPALPPAGWRRNRLGVHPGIPLLFPLWQLDPWQREFALPGQLLQLRGS